MSSAGGSASEVEGKVTPPTPGDRADLMVARLGAMGCALAAAMIAVTITAVYGASLPDELSDGQFVLALVLVLLAVTASVAASFVVAGVIRPTTEAIMTSQKAMLSEAKACRWAAVAMGVVTLLMLVVALMVFLP